jgi:hypothetical protein
MRYKLYQQGTIDKLIFSYNTYLFNIKDKNPWIFASTLASINNRYIPSLRIARNIKLHWQVIYNKQPQPQLHIDFYEN